MQHRSPAKSGKHTIDNQDVHTDAKMEATIIEQLVRQGFSDRWRRRRAGIAYGKYRYTPDIELSIDIDGISRRALVELKPFHSTDFPIADRRRACQAAGYYKDKDIVLLLYVNKTKRWYEIDRATAQLHECEPPRPGVRLISELLEPASLFTFTRFGRPYRTSAASATASVVEAGMLGVVRSLVGGKKPRSRRRK